MSELKLQMPSMPKREVTAKSSEVKKFSFSKPKKRGTRTAIYGTGGVGKTTLAAHAKGKKLFFDLDKSLNVLWPRLTDQGIADDVQVVDGIDSWDDMKAALGSNIFDGIDVIAIDTMTRLQELCAEWVPKNIKGEKGQVYSTIEQYPWGQGQGHLYDEFLNFFVLCERLSDEGKDIVLICHECTAYCPNPEGAEFLQYSPNLSNPKGGKSSIRLKLKDWVDNLLFVQNGKTVDKDGKATGTNERIVYPVDQAWAVAKSRVFGEPFLLSGYGEDMWSKIQGK